MSLCRGNKKIISITLVICLFVTGFYLNSSNTKAKSYTRAEVQKLLKETLEKKKRVERLYDQNAAEVDRFNDSLVYVDYPGFTYGVYIYGYLVVRDTKSGIFYAIKSGVDYIYVSDNYDGTYDVEGYIRPTGGIQQKGNVRLHYAVGYGTHERNYKYTDQYNKISWKVDDLKRALNLKYKFNEKKIKNKSFFVGKEYNLMKYLKNKEKYNTPIWSVDNKTVAKISKKGVLCVVSGGSVRISVKGNVSKNTTSIKLKCINSVQKTPSPIKTPTPSSGSIPIWPNYTTPPNNTSSPISSGTPTLTPVQTPIAPSSAPVQTPTVQPDTNWKDELTYKKGPYHLNGGASVGSSYIYYALYGDEIQISHTPDSLKPGFTYSSSDVDVATVDSSGLIKIVGNGIEKSKCEIYVTNGSQKHVIDVNIQIPLIYNKKEYTPAKNDKRSYYYEKNGYVYEGDTIRIKLDPDIFDAKFSIGELDSKWASVSESGIVTILKSPENGQHELNIYADYGVKTSNLTIKLCIDNLGRLEENDN